MEENWANHLGCIKPCKEWDKVPTSTGESRISSINSSSMSWNLIFFGLPKKHTYRCTIRILRCCDGGCCNGKRQIHVGSTLFGTAMSRGSETNDEFSGTECFLGLFFSVSSLFFVDTFEVHNFLQLFSLVWDLLSWMFLFLFLFFVSCFDTANFIQCDFMFICSPSLCIEILQRTYFQPRLLLHLYVLKLICSSFTLFSDSHDIFDSWVTSARKENRGCRIVVTQPRRIAAKGLATRVSQQAEGSSWKVLHGKWSIIKWYFWIFLDGIRIPSKMAAILSRWLDRLWNDL